MKKESFWFRKSFALLAVGGAPLLVLGLGGLGPVKSCTYNADLENLLMSSGDAVIQAISDRNFDDGVADSDYDLFIRNPGTDFFQAAWDNYVDLRLPDDPTTLR